MKCIIIVIILAIDFHFDVVSEDVGHFKHDDHLEPTRLAWLQADHTDVYIWVVDVVAR